MGKAIRDQRADARWSAEKSHRDRYYAEAAQIARDEIQTERLALDRLDGKLADDLDWRDPEIEPLDQRAEGRGVQLQPTILRKQLV
jgi:hypothetical protein